MASNNTLQFALGLSTGSFLGSLKSAGGAAKSMMGSLLSSAGLGVAVGGLFSGFTSLGSAVEKTFAQIEKGAALAELSRRTGESVATLFTLQKGMKAVGVESESLPLMIQQINKALGGTNEMGEPTGKIFESIGLSIEELNGMDAAGKINAISTALNKLATASATFAAGKILSRGNPGNMLQIARSGEEFAAAMKKAGPAALQAQRTAEAFNRLSTGMRQISTKADSFFAGIAEGAAPGIQAIVNALNKINLSGIGLKVGKVIGVILGSIQAGNFTEVISSAIAAGFEQGGNQAVRIWTGMMSVLGVLMARGVPEIAARAGAALKVLAMNINRNSMISSAVRFGLEADDAHVAGDFAKEDRLRALSNKYMETADNNQAGMDFEIDKERNRVKDDLTKVVEEAFNKGKDSFNTTGGVFGNSALEKLKGLIRAATANLPGDKTTKPAGTGTLAATKDAKTGRPESNLNDRERIGAIFGSGASGRDHAQRTADNTAKTVQILQQVLYAVQPVASGGCYAPIFNE